MADQLGFVDNPHAPELFASGAAGIFNLGGVIAITLESVKSDYSTNPGRLSRHVVGRLVMTPAGAHGLAIGLIDFLTNNGFIPKDDARLQ